MKPHRLSLDALNFPDASPLDLVSIAADTGFSHVSFALKSPGFVFEDSPVVRDRGMRDELRALMHAHGVALGNAECFNLPPDADVPGFRPFLETIAELGGRHAMVIVVENPDFADVVAKYGAFCDMAAEHGIRVNLEFFATCHSVPTLAAALAVTQEAGRPNAGLLIDILHLMRTGAGIAGLRALDPGMIGWAQLSDGPASVAPDAVSDEIAHNRLYPGEGALPIGAFLQSLPADVILGLEMPKHALAGQVPPLAQAKAMMAATRAAYAHIH